MNCIDKELAKHYLVELTGCDAEKIKFVKDVQGAFLRAAKKSKAKVLEYTFHQFEPFGVSGVILIAESHFATHTWPEDSYVALDIFTCGKIDPEIALEELKKEFGVKKVEVKIIPRGV